MGQIRTMESLKNRNDHVKIHYQGKKTKWKNLILQTNVRTQHAKTLELHAMAYLHNTETQEEKNYMLNALKMFLIKTIKKYPNLRGKDLIDTKETQKNKQKGPEKKVLCHTITNKTLKVYMLL